MIQKASELLQKFIELEKNKLKDFKMAHMPTLGSAYEEITKQGLHQDFAIPKDLELRVVSGFVSIGGTMLSEQIDCMIVHGEGRQYGLTNQFIYEIENILCIFEVKKRLNKSDFQDAMEHLAKIRRKFADHFEEKLEKGYEPDITRARKHFAQITGNVAPERYLDMNTLSKADSILFYVLVQESLAPITIIHGYEGYKTEKGLRSVFLDIIDDAWNKGNKRLGIPSIPTLVTSNSFCLVKGTGIPFIVTQKKEWVSVVSTRHNSAKIILELIWSKIGSHFNVNMPWNDGLHMDNVQPLLIAKAGEKDGKAGWIYDTRQFEERQMSREDDRQWQPATIGSAEVFAINIMAGNGGYLQLHEDLNHTFKKYKSTLKKVTDNLIKTHLFMVDNEYLRPIHHHTLVITNDDESGFVAYERERFDLWCEQNDIPRHYMHMYLMSNT